MGGEGKGAGGGDKDGMTLPYLPWLKYLGKGFL